MNGVAAKIIRRYAAASPRASGGVRMASRMCGAATAPKTASATGKRTKKLVAVPTIRLTMPMSRAPKAWPIMMLAAMLTPKAAPISNCMMMLAFEIAATAAAPSE